MAISGRFVATMKLNEAQGTNMINTYLRVMRSVQSEYNLDYRKLCDIEQGIISQWFDNIDFTVPDYYVAALFMTEPAITEAIYLHMKSFLRKYPLTFSAWKQPIKIVCLSNGTGFESFGLIRNFSECESTIGTPTKLDVAVLGRTMNWQRFFLKAYAGILNSDYCMSDYLTRVRLTSHFVEGDVEEYFGTLRERPPDATLSETVLEFVREADVVILARYLKYNPAADITSIVEDVGECMKRGSLLYLGIQECLSTSCNEYLKKAFITAHEDVEDVKLVPSIPIRGIRPILDLPSYPSAILWKNILQV